MAEAAGLMEASAMAEAAGLMEGGEDIGAAQLWALFQMQGDPTAFVHRMVDEVSFLPTAGQQWRRDVQLSLPADSSGQAPRAHLRGIAPRRQQFIVSLGKFTRTRFADFTVRDAAGNKLNLLTRQQHGHCLALSFMLKLFSEEQLMALSDHPTVFTGFPVLCGSVYELFTTVEATSRRADRQRTEPSAAALRAGEELRDLLSGLGATTGEIEDKVEQFVAEFGELEMETQYLCWVKGDPGETVNLSATYTMGEGQNVVRQSVARLVDDTPAPERGDRDKAPRRGVAWLTNHASSWRSSLQAKLDRWRIGRTAAYSRTGFTPLNYEFFPATDQAASYYLILKPPEDCRASYLDWGIDNSIDDLSGEVECAHHSIHIHNGRQADAKAEEEPILVNAFIRANSRGHSSLIIAASLTMLLAFLAERGQFVTDTTAGLSSILLLAPTAFLAFISQRKNHHTMLATRWLPWLMTIYLFANIVFLASVKYDVLGGDVLFGRPNALDDVISATMLITSAALIAWLIAIRINDWFIKQAFKRRKQDSDSLAVYCGLGIRYGDRTFAGLVLLVVVLGAVLAMAGWGSGRVTATACGESKPPIASSTTVANCAQFPTPLQPPAPECAGGCLVSPEYQAPISSMR